MSSNAPDPKKGQQDFIKGWPNPEMLVSAGLREALHESYKLGLEKSASTLNYGAVGEGAHMRGHPMFLEALAKFLSGEYGKEVDPTHLMSTGGSSMATDIACRVHTQVGDIAVFEAPTYYLAHQMMRERGLVLKEVPLHADGMDVEALDKLCTEEAGKVKVVYTVSSDRSRSVRARGPGRGVTWLTRRGRLHLYIFLQPFGLLSSLPLSAPATATTATAATAAVCERSPCENSLPISFFLSHTLSLSLSLSLSLVLPGPRRFRSITTPRASRCAWRRGSG